jgi:hypothetical protein
LKYKKKVILSMPGANSWTFMSFVRPSGTDVAVEWDVDQTLEAGLAFQNLVKTDGKTKDHTQWTSWRHKMKGDPGKHGVVELGFKADNREYRVLSKFNGSMCIVVLCICYHKGSVWTPSDAVSTATDRAKDVTAKKVKLNVIEITDHL